MKIISTFKGVIKEVFSIKKYILLALSVFFVVLFLALWLPNMNLLISILRDPAISLIEKTSFFFSSLLLLGTNFSYLGAFILIVEAILFSLNIIMLLYYFKLKTSFITGGASVGGMIIGFLGIGCASCGSILLSLFGFSGAVLFLPFKGQEFNFISVFLLLISLYVLVRRISEKACKIQ